MNYKISKKFYLLGSIFFLLPIHNINCSDIINDNNPNIEQTRFAGSQSCSFYCNCNVCAQAKTINIKTLPFTINVAGVYCLACDLESPSCDGDNAQPSILVTTDDVVVNLNGFILSGGSNGVQIMDQLRNVKIMNGTISDTTADGILVLQGCSSIQILDLQVINCNISRCSANGKGGITLQGLDGDRITKSQVSNCLVSGCIGTGIRLEFCDSSNISGCCALSIISNDNLLEPTGFYGKGDYNTFFNCIASEILSTLDMQNAYGFWLESSIANSLLNCESSNITSFLAAQNAYGFLFSAGSQCTVVKNCSSNRNSSDLNAYGFRSQNSSASMFFNCNACSNIATLLGEGFSLESDNFSCLGECVSQNNSNDGFLVSNCTDCSLGKNKSIENGATGFSLVSDNNNRFYANYASGNGNTPPVNNYVGGIAPVDPLGGAPKVGDNINGA